MRKILLSITLLTMMGCSTSVSPVPKTIDQLLTESHLSNQQTPRILLEDETHALTIFRVEWGEPQDCILGCNYNLYFGLQFGNRAGWIHSTGVGKRTFDFQSDDEYLFGTEFLETVRELNGGSMTGPYLGALAADDDTPVSTLRYIYEQFNLTCSNDKQMMKNPNLQDDEDLAALVEATIAEHCSGK